MLETDSKKAVDNISCNSPISLLEIKTKCLIAIFFNGIIVNVHRKLTTYSQTLSSVLSSVLME